jgi:hypothetical protein
MSLKDWREKHARRGRYHRTFFETKNHTWHVHRCGCGSKLFVPESEHGKGELAVGEERERG